MACIMEYPRPGVRKKNPSPVVRSRPNSSKQKELSAGRMTSSRLGGGLPYLGHIGMCRCEGYGFQAVFSGIGYINQKVWV